MHPPFPEAEVWRCGLWMTVSERQHVVIPRLSNPARNAVGGPDTLHTLTPNPGRGCTVPRRGGVEVEPVPGSRIREMEILGPPTVLLRRYFVEI